MTKNIFDSVFAQMPIQHGLLRQNTGRIQTLWMESGPSCNLGCGYCFAGSGVAEPYPEQLMVWNHFQAIIAEAASLGVDSIGIPGAGEPFHPRNRVMTMRILRECAQHGIFVTLFTTGEYLPELVAEIKLLPVELMLKCNSFNAKKQNDFVGRPARSGFGTRRNMALKMLMRQGFNDPNDPIALRHGRESRLALVTSIMHEEAPGGLSNVRDMPGILRFCRRNNVIFDCDSVLERGRGATCTLRMKGEATKAVLIDLQKIDREEFGRAWPLSQSYVGTVCDRFHHHLYITKYGDVHPCIGSVQVSLGNVRTDGTLAKAWERKEMRVIRSRNYAGACASCARFQRRECNSCLGRWSEDLTNDSLIQHGCVKTRKCWNYEET